MRGDGGFMRAELWGCRLRLGRTTPKPTSNGYRGTVHWELRLGYDGIYVERAFHESKSRILILPAVSQSRAVILETGDTGRPAVDDRFICVGPQWSHHINEQKASRTPSPRVRSSHTRGTGRYGCCSEEHHSAQRSSHCLRERRRSSKAIGASAAIDAGSGVVTCEARNFGPVVSLIYGPGAG